MSIMFSVCMSHMFTAFFFRMFSVQKDEGNVGQHTSVARRAYRALMYEAYYSVSGQLVYARTATCTRVQYIHS